MANFFNINFYTLGGLRFWRDCLVRKGWRIQQNLLFKSFRLLDNHNIRRASGSYRQCHKALNEYFSAWEISEEETEITFILPGLIRTRAAFGKMRNYLSEQGLNPIILSYSSSRHTVKQNAKTILSVLNNLKSNITKVNFIAYGLGGLIIREVLAMQGEWQQRITIGRIVQIAPPNQGSGIASSLARHFIFRLFFGKGLKDMSTEKAKNVPLFPPSTDFAVIAGFKGTDKGYNHLSKCDNDGFFCVNETKLTGASDFTVFKLPHFLLLSSPEVMEITERFITTGRFSGKRRIKKIKAAFQDVMNSI